MKCAEVEVGLPGNKLVVAAPLWSKWRTIDGDRPAN